LVESTARAANRALFPLTEFLHRDTIEVPGYDYNLTATKMTQGRDALIIDIDVFTTTRLPLEETLLEEHLTEMRWLKNKAFFGIIADEVKDKL